MGNANKELAGSCPGAELKEGKRFPADVSAEELKAWAKGFGIRLSVKTPGGGLLQGINRK